MDEEQEIANISKADEPIVDDVSVDENPVIESAKVEELLDNAQLADQDDSEDYLTTREGREEILVDEEIAPEPIEVEAVQQQYKTPIERLFFHEIPKNSKRSDKLRLHLAAPVVFRITNSKEVFTIDWTGTDIKVSAGDAEKPGCVILIRDSHLLDIASGALNPQVAMLSDKIEIEGQMELAVYVFNLIDRRSSWI